MRFHLHRFLLLVPLIFGACFNSPLVPGTPNSPLSENIQSMTVTENRLLASIKFVYAGDNAANSAQVTAGAEPYTITAIPGRYNKFYRILDYTYAWNFDVLETIVNQGRRLEVTYISERPGIAYEIDNLSADTLSILKFGYFGDNLSEIRVYNNKGVNLENHYWDSFDSEKNSFKKIWWIYHTGVVEESTLPGIFPVVYFMANNPLEYTYEKVGAVTEIDNYITRYLYDERGNVTQQTVESESGTRIYQMNYENEE